MGLSYIDYCKCTLREFNIRKEGYLRMENRRIDETVTLFKNGNIESWRQSRLIAWLISIKYQGNRIKHLYDWLPLPDDPTKEDIERLLLEDANNERDYAQELLNEFHKRKAK